MEKGVSPIDRILKQIERCNEEVNRLSHSPEEADEVVNPGPHFESDQFKITRKNKIELDREVYVDQLRHHLARLNLGVRSNSHIPTQSISGEKYIAFLDILGFSDIVKRNSLAEMTTLMNFIHTDIQMGLASEELGKNRFKLYSYGFAPDLSEVPISVILLSDTIVFWTKDNSPESFYLLLRLVTNFMNQEVYFRGIGLRGSITVGELGYIGGELNTQLSILNFSTIYGKALVEAYHLEKEQEWIGCIVTDRAVNTFLFECTGETDDKLDKEIFNNFLIRYDVPFKDNIENKGQNYVIRWPRGLRANDDYNLLTSCFTQHQKLDKIPAGSVQTKFNNTWAFIGYVEQVYNSKNSAEDKTNE